MQENLTKCLALAFLACSQVWPPSVADGAAEAVIQTEPYHDLHLHICALQQLADLRRIEGEFLIVKDLASETASMFGVLSRISLLLTQWNIAFITPI